MLDREGWLHTGDLAEIRDGRIFIRGPPERRAGALERRKASAPQDVELAILGTEYSNNPS